MAKVVPTERVAVVERGVALLALINAAEGGVLMLTQDEGAEAVGAGFAVVDTTRTEGNTAAVSLTTEGKAALAAAGEPVVSVAASTGFAIDTDVAMPTKGANRRGRSGGYPFEALQVNQSFHVSKPDDVDTLDTLLTRLSSSVSGARIKFAVETGENETVTVKTYKRNPDGKGFVKDADGKRVVETETSEVRPVMKNTRDFFAAKVDGTDPKGAGVRIWRTA